MHSNISRLSSKNHGKWISYVIFIKTKGVNSRVMKLDYMFLISNLGQLTGTGAIFSFWCDSWLVKSTSQLTPSCIHPDDTADWIGEHIIHLNFGRQWTYWEMNVKRIVALRYCCPWLMQVVLASLLKIIKLLGVENMSSTQRIHANGSIWTMVVNFSIIKTQFL